MIKGFEDFTHELTEEEMELVPKFINSFSNKIGENKAIKTKEIVAGMQSFGHKMSPPRVRKIVNYLRRSGRVKRLVATSKGYYIENNDEKWNDFVQSMFDRAGAIEAVAIACSEQ